MSTKISFPYDEDRAAHASRWLLKRHGGEMDRLKLVKLIFLADRMHLARYGRPIVGGRYVAMEHGPVASEFLTLIKTNQVSGVACLGSYKQVALADADEEMLSESDLEVLGEVNDAFGAYDTFRLRDYTHTFRAWIKNYKGGNSSFPLAYEDFFDDLPAEAKQMLDLIEDAQEAEKIVG